MGSAAHPYLPRRADLRSLFSLAIPVVVVHLGLMAMGVVDTILVGHASAADLAGAALGNLYFYGVCAFGMGTLFALDPIVSQAVGARDTEAVGRAVQRGLLLAAALTVPLSALFLPAGWLLRQLHQQPDVVPIAAGFCRVSIPGILPFLGFIVLRQSLQSMGRLRPIVITIVVANLLNAALGWVFVFGHLGCPPLGAVGAGIASTLARWGLLATLLPIAWKELRPCLIPPRRDVARLSPLVHMFRIGAPIGVQLQLEFGVFTVVALLMGRLGTVPIAAHQVAIIIASFTFMVPLGLGSAAAVRVGQAIGAQDPDAARRAAVAALASGAGFMLLSGATLRLVPGLLARVYSSDPAVIAMASALIPIAGVFQVFDGLQVVAIGVLRGVGDTRTPMLVNVLGFWVIGMPVSLWLAFSRGGGAVGLWWGLVVGLAVVAIFLLMRVRWRFARDLERLQVEDESPAIGVTVATE